jgi:oligopeptide transport system substrate-binding protein
MHSQKDLIKGYTYMPLRLFGVLACLLWITSCSHDDTPVEQDTSTLKISIGASPQSLDPHVVTGVPGIKVISALGEPLVSLNLETLEVEPGLAKSWHISEDGLHYTFKLREQARWSNGDPVTAEDFVFTWQRAMTPAIGWQYATDYYFIEGAQDYHLGKVTDPNTLGVKASDPTTLEFHLNKPSPVFLKSLTSAQSNPLHKSTLESLGAFDDTGVNWTKPGSYLSNGPFVLQKWELNQVIELVKNPYYWDADNVSLENIHVYPIEGESAEERAFRAGQIQVAHGGRIPVDKIKKYRSEKPQNLRIVNGYATYFYLFNVTKAPFDDVRVRQALAHAIDRESIVKNITKAGEGVATTLNPPVSSYHAHVSPLKYNLEKAKTLLADAGYPNGEGFPASTLIYNTSELHLKVALAIQQMWKQNLGIDITMENQEWKVFLDTRQNLNYDIARAGSVSGIGDPQDFLESYMGGHGMNDTGWRNENFDKLINEAKQTLDEAKRVQILSEAESILLADLPLIPLYYYANSYLVSEEVKGLIFNPLSRINFKDIYIEPHEAP